MKFKTLSIKNFLSYPNKETKINLDKNKLISITGANGEGKSSIVDSFFFVLTGKSYRGINKDKLVNKTNKKNCVVELEFEFNSSNYRVVRGVKPNLFEIYKDDELLDQTSHVNDYQNILENFIGLSPSVLKQTVLISSRFYTPFLELNPQEKRDFIENLLSLKVFGVMIDLIKSDISSLKQEELSLSKDLERVKSNIELTKEYIKKEEEKKQKDLFLIQENIEKNKDQILDYNEQIEKYNNALIELEKKKTKLNEGIEKFSSVSYKKKQIENDINKDNDLIRFYSNNQTCPKCYQEINEDIKIKNLNELNQSIEEKKLKIENYIKGINKLNQLQEAHNKIYNRIKECNSELIKCQNSVMFLNKQIQTLEKELNNKSESEDVSEKLSLLEKEKNNLFKLTSKNQNAKIVSSSLQNLLSEKGIKKFILGKYIPVLNKLVNEYLQLLDAKYVIEFNESLETMISHRGQETDYKSFSSGEKSRCDLALLFSFLDIARNRNNHESNLIIFDECFYDLDEAGIIGLKNIFEGMKKKGFSVFVITHTDGISDMCDEKWQVVKKKFSKIINVDN